MTIALKPFIEQQKTTSSGESRNLGAFAAACYTHTNFTAAYPLINEKNFYEAFHNFYFAIEEGGKAPSSVLVDDCGEMCNEPC